MIFYLVLYNKKVPTLLNIFSDIIAVKYPFLELYL